MSEQMVGKWKKAKLERESAEKWNNLPKGKRYQNDDFGLMVSHSTAPMLMRGGQRYSGDKNYWKSDAGLNAVILEYIIDKWDDLYPKMLERLKRKEAIALKECQSYVNEMQAMIDVA